MLRDEERMDAVALLQHEVRDARRVGDGPGLLAHEGEREVAVRVRHLKAAPLVEAVAVRAVATVGRVGGRTPLLVLVSARPAVPRKGRNVVCRLHPRAVVGRVPGAVLAAEGESGRFCLEEESIPVVGTARRAVRAAIVTFAFMRISSCCRCQTGAAACRPYRGRATSISRLPHFCASAWVGNHTSMRKPFTREPVSSTTPSP